MPSSDKDLKNKSYNDLLELTQQYGQKNFCASYIFSFVHQKDAAQIDDITPLPKLFRQNLKSAGYGISHVNVSERHDDPDGTVKFVFGLEDGVRIESVLLKDNNRNTLCISTQAGCRMGCRFCATGQLKYQRNLTAAEIVDQVYKTEPTCGKIHNVVYMGMGEPLDNFDHVMRSIEILNDPKGRNIGIRRITVSTCGLCEPIKQLALSLIQPRLAVSLHASNDTIRSKIMRMSPKQSIDRLMAALKNYQSVTNRRITIEYCMIDGINDSVEQAKSLIKLLHPLKVNVNLIELNPFPACVFQASSPEQIQRFAKILTDAGIETVIRFKRGRTIKAACGQLGATWLKAGMN
jgi:23S rRNA (adenine2503-C2)-methyltransferase